MWPLPKSSIAVVPLDLSPQQRPHYSTSPADVSLKAGGGTKDRYVEKGEPETA